MKLWNEIYLNQIKKVFNKKKYRFFEWGDYNLNIIGVRRDSNISNSFDDYLCCIYYDTENKINIKQWEITTDPGRYWLKNPMNPQGTAILVPYQYRGTWKIAKHQGKYTALCQRKAVKVFRDNNKDNILDYDSETIDKGLFGINIHRSNPYSESYVVEKWSAGCQVFKRVEDFDEFMGLIHISAVNYGDNFTYTLIEEQDFYLV